MDCNETDTDDCATEYHESWVPPFIQFLLGVGGNALALLLLALSRKHHKWRPFYRLVCCLALTDFLGIMLVYPLVMVRYASNFSYKFPDALCHYYVSFIFTCAPMSSAFIICAMSIDRFWAVLFPFSYRGHSKYRRVNLMLTIQLVAALIISGLHLVGLGDAHDFYPKSWCFFNFTAKDLRNRINSYIYSIIGIVTVVVMVILNAVVIVTLCRRSQCGNCVDSQQNRTDDRNNLKVIVFLIVIVLVLAGFWLPLMINILLHAATVLHGEGKTELLVLRLAVTNAIVDPWIYILLRRETLELGQHFIGTQFSRCAGLVKRGSDRQSLSDSPPRRQPEPEGGGDQPAGDQVQTSEGGVDQPVGNQEKTGTRAATRY